MLNRLTRKLFTLFVRSAALAAVSFTPASSTNSRSRYCFEAPLEYGCNPNVVCCYDDGHCSCG
jgi:hypothetical protein